MADSIFTKIIKGEIPSYKIYEDDQTLAFLDVHPVAPGHTLIVPKQQIEWVWDLPDELYQAVMASAKKVANHMLEVLDAPYVSERITGVDVPHAHVQLIPFSDAKQLAFNPDMDAEPNHPELAALAAKLAF